jgi:hypothetical protein
MAKTDVESVFQRGNIKGIRHLPLLRLRIARQCWEPMELHPGTGIELPPEVMLFHARASVL